MIFPYIYIETVNKWLEDKKDPFFGVRTIGGVLYLHDSSDVEEEGGHGYKELAIVHDSRGQSTFLKYKNPLHFSFLLSNLVRPKNYSSLLLVNLVGVPADLYRDS